MNPTKETKWLCENARSLEKFSGKWILFSVMEGVVSEGTSLETVIQTGKKLKCHEKSFVLHVPSKAELDSPVPTLPSPHKSV